MMATRAPQPADGRPLIVHVIHRFAVGGLENGVVNLINGMSASRWRHAVLALTEVAEEFSTRVQRSDVTYHSLSKASGHLLYLYPRIYKLLRELRPAIIHSRNLAALEAQAPAWMARVPVRVHSEHGWDVTDLQGDSLRYRWVRRAYGPFVHQYIALSQHLEGYLRDSVGVRARRIAQIYNGVDTLKFRPPKGVRPLMRGCPFTEPGLWLVGTVARMEAVKDPLNLARAFVHALRLEPSASRRLRLVMVGDGSLLSSAEEVLIAHGVRHLAWFTGERDDVPDILRGLDCFALPSLAEGISNTILEAMASGIPVVATHVGGNAELVEDGLTGRLVPPANSEALGVAILAYFWDPPAARRHGKAGRNLVERCFSLERMVKDYDALYTKLLRGIYPVQIRTSQA